MIISKFINRTGVILQIAFAALQAAFMFLFFSSKIDFTKSLTVAVLGCRVYIESGCQSITALTTSGVL